MIKDITATEIIRRQQDWVARLEWALFGYQLIRTLAILERRGFLPPK